MSGLEFPIPFAGLDEAGRGCLAGPVVAAAVILPAGYTLAGLADSKTIPAVRRQSLAWDVRSQALAWAVGYAWPQEIEAVNILQATLAAMARAIARLRVVPACLIIDGNKTIPSYLLRAYGLPIIPQRAVVGGDALVPAISAASILAKTVRDQLLITLDRRYPGYGLARHKGYGTVEHRIALQVLGPCPQHRRTFRGIGREVSTGARIQQHLWLPGITG